MEKLYSSRKGKRIYKVECLGSHPVGQAGKRLIDKVNVIRRKKKKAWMWARMETYPTEMNVEVFKGNPFTFS